MTSVCAIRVESRLVELRVRFDEPDRWVWSISIEGGKHLSQGAMMNKLAAQLTSQIAFENRLYRAGLSKFAPKTYSWQDLVT